MNSDYPLSLLNSLRAGKIKPSDLTGEQFQSIIFHRLTELCLKSTEYEYELVDAYQGAVDFVVREKPRHLSPFHTECATHVFECKHYRRTLELSTVAKLLVFGVRFQPASLNIVSRTSLQPQVYEYARVLFGGLGNEGAMFRSTFFRHFRTSDLLNLEISSETEEQSDALVAFQDRNLDLGWEIVECQPFYERIIASSQHQNSTVLLSGQWPHRLRIWLTTTNDPKDINIWTDCEPNITKTHVGEPRVVHLDTGNCHINLIQILDSRQVERKIGGHLCVHASFKTLSHRVLTVPFLAEPAIVQVPSADFRQREVDDFADQLKRRTAPHALLLGGVAGVGKTHFCEQLAVRVRANASFDVNRFSAHSEVETSLIRTMLVTICTPSVERCQRADEWHELANTLLDALSGTDNEHSSRMSAETIDVVIPVLAELLVRGGPRMVVIRDAHRISAQTARELSVLVTRLDDLGWGSVYFVFEHRTGEPQNNVSWTTLESGIRGRVNDSVAVDLEPLSKEDLEAFLQSSFTHITPELMNAVWNWCGGIPLYLSSVFNLLKSQKAIAYLGQGKWNIVTPSAFLAPQSTRRRADEVLRERLKAISWVGTNLPQQFQKDPWPLVALLAIASEPDRVQKLCQFIDIDDLILASTRHLLMWHNVMQPSASEWAFHFQHDLLRQAAIEMGRTSAAAQSLVERALAAMWKGEQTVLELELGSDLAAWIGFWGDSNRALNAAYERLRASHDFTLIQRILYKLCRGLQSEAFSSAKQCSEYLSCSFALAWTTWNTGSLTEARSQYARLAHDALRSTRAGLDSTIAEAFAADAERRVLGLDLELGKIEQFFKSAHRALTLKGDSVVFNSIINRLVLYCAEFSHVDFGLELSRMAVQAFGDPKSESAGAVICSDMGRLFRAVALRDALLLYRQGVSLARDSRQMLYNNMDVFITEILLGDRQLGDHDIIEWRRTLRESGLKGMLLRFDFFCAAINLQTGHTSQALRQMQQIETSIAVYRYDGWWLSLWNNKLIAALLNDNREQVEMLGRLILETAEQLLVERQIGITDLAGLRPLIQQQLDRFSHLEPLDVHVPQHRHPVYSGTIMQVLLNMDLVARHLKGPAQAIFKASRELWPRDIDYDKAREVALSQPRAATVEVCGTKLALCV